MHAVGFVKYSIANLTQVWRSQIILNVGGIDMIWHTIMYFTAQFVKTSINLWYHKLSLGRMLSN